MSGKLWVYNYNFEFEFAEQKPIRFGETQKIPWWFLNRSSTILIPLTQSDDAILTYQPPPDRLLQQYQEQFDQLPRFIFPELIVQESNCIFSDLNQFVSDGKYYNFELAPWGWSPKAIKLATKNFNNTLAPNFQEVIRQANSKQTSDNIRNKYLPDSLNIPSKQITNQNISLKTLRNEIYRFISDFPQVKIKHYFGASGRLTDTIRDLTISSKKLELWFSWLKQSGGILLEKVLEIDTEFSIQAEIECMESISVLTLTRLFSNKNGSYLGNLIDSTESSLSANLKKSVQPLFKHLAEIGYRGPLGLDLLKTKDGELKLVEINARLTMGRIAYEWDRALNKLRFGFFTNFFIKNPDSPDISAFISFCHMLEKRFNCNISIINMVHSTQGPNSLVTIFIGANRKNFIRNTLVEIYPSVFQGINL